MSTSDRPIHSGGWSPFRSQSALSSSLSLLLPLPSLPPLSSLPEPPKTLKFLWKRTKMYDDDVCFTPFWRVPNQREGPTQAVDPVVAVRTRFFLQCLMRKIMTTSSGTRRICGTSMRTVEVPGFLRKRSISESTPTDIQVFYHFETVLSNGTRRCHPHNSRSLFKRILFQFVCSGLRGEIESIPATVLHCTSTKRRHCSTQQTVRSAADLSKIDSTTTSRLHPRIEHSIIKTHGAGKMRDFAQFFRNHS